MKEFFERLSTPKVDAERLNPEQGYTAAIRQAGNQGEVNKLPPNYEVDTSFGDKGYINGSTGVKVVAVIDTETGERIIAVAGTDKGSAGEAVQDMKDWPNAGRAQWDEIKDEVKGYTARQPEGAKVRLTGHSLGGGVVQHGMHDLKNPEGQ